MRLLQTCPTKNKEMCPYKPKKEDCVKTKCLADKPGFGYVKIGNCFGKNIQKVLAEHTDYNGYPVCDKFKCVGGINCPAAATHLHSSYFQHIVKCCMHHDDVHPGLRNDAREVFVHANLDFAFFRAASLSGKPKPVRDGNQQL